MPDFEKHCKISKARTGGEPFEELHKWMDEATAYLGHNHRLERHFFTQEYMEFIQRTWGEKAVVEWLFHIAVDNLETANKFAINSYNKNFDKILFEFDGKELSYCDFIKKFPNSSKHFAVDLLSGEEKEFYTTD